ncbi:MAG: LysM peptidoglycan-binding domain-containing protein [Planctomycetota bacterium]|jgi:nucleoid-associated protein YgaU
MTSDAKIGLLLGLVFIFVIAFLINGLPSFSRGGDTNSSELSKNIVSLQNDTIGVDSDKIEIIRGRTQPKYQRPARVEPKAVVAKEDPASAELEPPLTAEESVGQEKEVEVPLPAEPVVEEKRHEIWKVAPPKPVLPRVYLVQEGENLSEIAKKFYGPQEGNRIVNVNRIFKANREVMKSADDVKAGQKIVIPSLEAEVRSTNRIKDFLRNSIFERAESVGKRNRVNTGSKSKATRQYVVKEDDNLWRIATEQLGDGKRYAEIVKLNSGILEDADVVVAGTRLQLPAR